MTARIPRLTVARYVHGDTLWLCVADGVEGEVRLSGEIEGDIVEPLRQAGCFQQMAFNPELRIVVWPHGTDFAPEFLHAALRIVG